MGSFISRALGVLALSIITFWPEMALASAPAAGAEHSGNYTHHWAGILALIIFVSGYALVIVEEKIHMRKSKPLMVAAGLIWLLTTVIYNQVGRGDEIGALLRHNLLEFAELLLFLLSAMTYINTMKERNLFDALKSKIISSGLSLRATFWITGILAFFMSPVADNLTTALVMGAVVMAVGVGNPKFILLACINVVVAANAGGAFSPFGDITTLMVWQKGIVDFWGFFALFIPAAVSWIVPALIMSFAIAKKQPKKGGAKQKVKKGGYFVAALFLMTIALTVITQHKMDIPPFLGMMTGLGFLKIFGYFIARKEIKAPADLDLSPIENYKVAKKPFDVFISMKRVEWDTLMFFYGVMICVGGLSALGYLATTSNFLYEGFGQTNANIAVGVISAIVDNIPVMFAVLNMNLDMPTSQWLLVTLTAGIGGSLLSVGSAAGVALMGQARGLYTFMAHLKWTWAIALGYGAGIGVHILMNF